MMLKQLFYGKLFTESNPSFYNSLGLNDFKPDTSGCIYIFFTLLLLNFEFHTGVIVVPFLPYPELFTK